MHFITCPENPIEIPMTFSHFNFKTALTFEMKSQDYIDKKNLIIIFDIEMILKPGDSYHTIVMTTTDP